jgi:multidrug efflux system membrane fusion protein
MTTAFPALALALMAGLAGCHGADGKAEAKPAGGGAPVSASTVAEKDIVETQEFSGRMEAIERVDIRARVAGFITAVNVHPGAIVKKGDVLFVIDPRPYQRELARAEAAAGAARAKADLAKIELTRAERLIADKAIAQRELDTNSSSYKQLDAEAHAADAQLETAKLNLAYTQVLSPIDGRVGKAEITLGNLVDTSAILTTVVSKDRIYASFVGDEDTYLRVAATHHQGQPVLVRVGLANETGYPHAGKLEFVDNQLDTQTGGVRMRAVFDNADNLLVPGLFARVQIDAGTGGGDASGVKHTRALLINERAIGTDQSRKFVYLIGPDQKAEYRTVTLGARANGMVQVTQGLKAGDTIVVNGTQRVHPGAPLSPHMVAMDFDPDAPEAKPADKPAPKG